MEDIQEHAHYSDISWDMRFMEVIQYMEDITYPGHEVIKAEVIQYIEVTTYPGTWKFNISRDMEVQHIPGHKSSTYPGT